MYIYIYIHIHIHIHKHPRYEYTTGIVGCRGVAGESYVARFLNARLNQQKS